MTCLSLLHPESLLSSESILSEHNSEDLSQMEERIPLYPPSASLPVLPMQKKRKHSQQRTMFQRNGLGILKPEKGLGAGGRATGTGGGEEAFAKATAQDTSPLKD